jgi:hypothetical protein
MSEVLENELLGYVLRPLGDDAAEIADVLSDDDAALLRTTLREFLVAEAAAGDDVIQRTVSVPKATKLGSVLYRDGGKRDSNTLVAFTFKSAAAETALPLLGIALTIFTGKWGLGSVTPVASVIKTLWSKLIVLRRPADGEAIDVLETILRARARLLASGRREYPTTAEVKALVPLL